mmetsp:Transcript_1305/g.1760  ORF Transcript_1305/g.1760 Transcript_1305/m.1760 type:complete len:561 (+) Transcript_1305:146-1828(+)|eukprot:CAMPEP_0202446556 /NCGR_PEP_ID=MMETSP1360-20130828/5068_1 /ASSEMBLY_ACC=CAM_ASM_000848 /TAXON_ID=515479 /ORGANISM="Licmophora paradoxa, Strain CCMP2313" /LENGTH=560 /DNA_ID=CAMNT_0049063103 /DNA_START=98 /DNA_END=1780 /DNA_ORIENTATION=+
MSLGLTRDSILNLSDLVSQNSDEPQSSATVNNTEVGESSEVLVGLDHGPAVDVTSFKQPKNESAGTKNKFSYTAFTADYSAYDAHYGQVSYSQDPYAPTIFGNRAGTGGLWCCLFPWSNQNKVKPEPELDDGEQLVEQNESNEIDELSTTDSEAYGEKLTEKDRAAVLARLRLAGPHTLDQPKKKGLLNQEPTALGDKQNKDQKDLPPPPPPQPRHKSILKRGSVSTTSMNKGQADKSSVASKDASSRRSLFPDYGEKPKKETVYHVQFAPMARVMTVKSRNEMGADEKKGVWWQKADYDDFKKAGRLIAKAMLEGGSEVWLATNKSWRANNGVNKVNGNRAFHLSERGDIDQTTGDPASNAASDKWWHKFGHSRRGLEHIASVEEGRQRQAKVRTAIRAVVDEQRRQRIYRKEDPEKLRMLTLQYTTWARDLAHAAGASDAEAVAVDFDPSRKSREFFLLKHARANGGFAQELPAFMVPVAVPPSTLDAHTNSQIRYRRKVQQKAERLVDVNSGADSRPSIAKQAAGYGTAEADMAAVLSGLGADSRVKPLIARGVVSH